MSKKMTISELRAFIKGQATELYEAHISEERKKRLDKHIASKKKIEPSGPETKG